MARVGRPSRLTPAVQAQVCRAIAAGNYIDTAAEIVGIGRSTLYRWLAAADGGEPKYEAFRDAIKRARARAEARSVAAVLRAGKRQWTAHAWFLERSFPDRWRRRGHHEEISREAIAESRAPDPDISERISEALRRNPNHIPEALAAMKVLQRIMQDGATD